MKMAYTTFLLFTLTLMCGAASPSLASHSFDEHSWNKEQTKILAAMTLAALPALPVDSSNKYADNRQAIALGKKIFSDTRFSANKMVSCATCHRPDYHFTDDLPRAHGLAFTKRRSMPLAGVAFSPWLFWDGRKDSLWSQALGPMESAGEHGISRSFATQLIRQHYLAEYEAIFGPFPALLQTHTPPAIARPADDNPKALALWNKLPEEERQQINKVYANIGKAIGAYVRHILPGESRFDRYVYALQAGNRDRMATLLTTDEALGLRLFIGKAKCTNCHNGPLFTDFDFHNVGVAAAGGTGSDIGRAEGIPKVKADEFNCLGPYSDATGGGCAELRFMNDDTTQFMGAFKTPSLRGVSQRSPYMHAGQFATLQEVLQHYATVKPDGRISAALNHRGLSTSEQHQLVMFLHSLDNVVLSP